ncbi:MAG: hypothetical protein AVDCRST_MAG20-1138 [uncultured Acidimicrobiales bacterium]|uniref:Uncharacterized protein n=1 Tax=uncultured Acidimicrobiales bacterium TaxID=310071 RepID=A0A6J4HQE2_9ACTN|nr:MAG: hypothetical protein AVDCRST_MAG20-1138 [uncultured Acidimicrobiales bacterium]
MRHLVTVVGPIGAGKSTIAALLARRAQAAGMTACPADLDDLAFAQRADLDLAELWRRAGVAHSALVRGWFDAGVDVVIAHGPFFESRSWESLLAAAPADSRHHHVLLRVTFEVALARVQSDPGRGRGARSVQAEFLRATHESFAGLIEGLPRIDIDVDTSASTADEVADRVFHLLELDALSTSCRTERQPG